MIGCYLFNVIDETITHQTTTVDHSLMEKASEKTVGRTMRILKVLTVAGEISRAVRFF